MPLPRVLIVGADDDLGHCWALHLQREGLRAVRVASNEAAADALRHDRYDAIVLDLGLPDEGAIALADFALYRQPEARVIFVTGGHAYADGSIFALSGNASAYLNADVPPEDLAAIVGYHAGAR